jgi:ABC-type polysaccharide/polyol phosphate transport system ATPase subunit
MTRAGAIEFAGVSKVFYRNAGRALLRKHVESWFRGSHKEPFYALKDVSFRIQPGEGVALIGTNGAGKSTLLSLVAGVAESDMGSVRVKGRISALLQLGAGFHADLTGAENVRLNAALLGMSRRRTDELFEEIVDFAGIEEFIQEPLRTYSSGMTMRLAFAVAMCLDPDVFITDEVLAVGDHAFQAKCREKIVGLKRAGKTLLCVSHAAHGVLDLCERGLWLERGEIVRDGPLSEVLKAYEGICASSGA